MLLEGFGCCRREVNALSLGGETYGRMSECGERSGMGKEEKVELNRREGGEKERENKERK